MCYVWWSVNQIMVKFEINLKTEPLAWPLFIKDGLSSKSLGQIRYNEYEHRKRRPEGPHQHWSFRGSAGVFRCDHRPLKKGLIRQRQENCRLFRKARPRSIFQLNRRLGGPEALRVPICTIGRRPQEVDR